MKAKENVIMLGFDENGIDDILEKNMDSKLVIFDENDAYRETFEKFHQKYKDRITFFEGSIRDNFNGFVKLRREENRTPYTKIVCRDKNLLVDVFF